LLASENNKKFDIRFEGSIRVDRFHMRKKGISEGRAKETTTTKSKSFTQ